MSEPGPAGPGSAISHATAAMLLKQAPSEWRECLEVRVDIIGHACSKYVGKCQSCMVDTQLICDLIDLNEDRGGIHYVLPQIDHGG